MEQVNFNDIKVRCSSIGYIMTEPKSKKEGLSKTCRGHLADLYVRARYNRKTDMTNKYTLKGNLVEEDSLTLYSLQKGQFFKKNKDNFANDWITGTPDIIDGDTIIDIKSSWDIFTFFRNNDDALNAAYYWQLQGYMFLTGAKKAILAYCLVNTPGVLISDEKRKLFYALNAGTEENKEYIDACAELDKLMIYDDIPTDEKVIEINIERDETAIEAIKTRVSECREYMRYKYGSTPSILSATHDKEVKATIVTQLK